MLGVLTMNINFLGFTVQYYFGEAVSPRTGRLEYWGRVLHVTTPWGWYKNFRLGGITPSSPKWKDHFDV